MLATAWVSPRAAAPPGWQGVCLSHTRRATWRLYSKSSLKLCNAQLLCVAAPSATSPQDSAWCTNPLPLDWALLVLHRRCCYCRCRCHRRRRRCRILAAAAVALLPLALPHS